MLGNSRILTYQKYVYFKNVINSHQFVCTKRLFSEDTPKPLIKLRQINSPSGKTSIKKTLLTTNYMLYGPLLKKTKPSKKTLKDKSKTSLNDPKLATLENGSEKELKNKFTEKEFQLFKHKIVKNENFKTELDNLRIKSSIVKEIEQHPLFNSNKSTNETYLSSDTPVYNISIFDGGYNSFPSVHKILQESMPKDRKIILQKWEKKMISQLGEEGFSNYKQSTLDRGQNFHKCIELNLKEQPVKPEQLVGIENYWKSIENILPTLEQVSVIESRVLHPSLEYQGCVDCVGIYKGIPVVIEFKTSSKPKLTLDSTYDDPLQLAAYIGALNFDENYSLPNISEALLIVAYSTGLPAHAHFISKKEMEIYWQMWCRRLSKFKFAQGPSD